MLTLPTLIIVWIVSLENYWIVWIQHGLRNSRDCTAKVLTKIIYPKWQLLQEFYKTSQKLQKTASRTSHQLSRCQNVLIKGPLKISYKLRFVIIQVLSQIQFLSFVTIQVFKFCHYLSFDICHNLIIVTFLAIKFCHNLSSVYLFIP